MRRHPAQMCPAGTVLDRDQRVDPPEEHGVHVHEIHGQDSLGLRAYSADRLQASLESSNSSVTTLIPELTIAQKTFTGLAKLLTVFTQDLDTSMGTIKG